MATKLFCTFSNNYNYENDISTIKSDYTIIYNKIFVLSCSESDELFITYNLDTSNINNIPCNTISVHRRKETNTIYTINALNNLIMMFNNGILDKSFPINWNEFNNKIILFNRDEITIQDTKLYKIIQN